MAQDNRPFHEIPEPHRNCPDCQGRMVYWVLEGKDSKPFHVKVECTNPIHEVKK
jgi:hypothetical protein